jgi:UDP-N-acetylmuramate-alanine ligase
MWHYLPHTAVVTNVEFDHADIYRDEIALPLRVRSAS